MMEGMDGFSAGWGRRRCPDDVRSVAVGLAVRIGEEAAVAGRDREPTETGDPIPAERLMSAAV
jgi:hypothetical protein